MADPTGAGEFAAISRIAARRWGTPGPQELWIGDDAAVVDVGGALVAIAADALAAGVHADLTLTTVADLGWKALAVNVSDLAAMGVVPACAVVTVSGPPATDLDALYDGIEAASRSFGCPVVGGDLTSAPSLVVSVTVVGSAAVAPPPVRRGGARPGDEIWVSGPLGAAAAELRTRRPGPAHARPVPRVAEGVAAREAGATAMIDVSDGFAADLGHLLDASGVGCALDTVPVAAGGNMTDALAGGDDYELVWCSPPGAAVEAVFAARGLRRPLRVGTCVADRGSRPPAAAGWEHRFEKE